MAHSLSPRLAMILAAGDFEIAKMVLAVLGFLLGAALLFAFCGWLVYLMIKPGKEHQQKIYQDLERLGLIRTEQPEAMLMIYEGIVDGCPVLVSFHAGSRLVARVAVILRRPLGIGLEIVRRPGRSWPRESSLTWEEFERYFQTSTDDPDRAGELLDSGAIRQAAARVLETEDVLFNAVIRGDQIETRALYNRSTDPGFLSPIIRNALALEKLLHAYQESASHSQPHAHV